MAPERRKNLFKRRSYAMNRIAYSERLCQALREKLFDGKNTEFVDAVHGTDLMYLKMFMYMAERSKSIRNYVDIDKLNFFLKESTGDFLSF